MNTQEFYTRVLVPATVAFPFSDSPAARTVLLTIAGQESGYTAREQTNGPARGFWQFERGGGIAGVLGNAAAAQVLCGWCAEMEIPSDEYTLYEAVMWNDNLAYALARLLVWTDPRPLPSDSTGGWLLYQRLWRPGSPRPASWPQLWSGATTLLA